MLLNQTFVVLCCKKLLKDCYCVAFSSFVVLCRGRVGLMPDSSLYIEAPKETDFGFYTCHATNNLGSTSHLFQVQKAGKEIAQKLPERSFDIAEACVDTKICSI